MKEQTEQAKVIEITDNACKRQGCHIDEKVLPFSGTQEEFERQLEEQLAA